MPSGELPVIYWDASAIVSVLFKDRSSARAFKWAARDGVHLLSSLAYAETCAVISRLKRERILADVLIQAALETLHQGPWRRLNSSPDWKLVALLADKWSLRGADLWHLAAAKSLQSEFPELVLLTYDARLRAAAEGERLSA